MSVQESQGIKEFSYAELCERARKEAEKHQKNIEQKKRKGLEFMGLKLDIAEMHLQLAVKKLITPAEDNLLKIIEMGTIGARNSRSQICSKSEFYLEDLALILGILKNKVYVHLKSLEKKNYIVREKTRSKGREVLGLNPKVFGQILPDQQHERERRRHLKLVDNNPNGVDNSGSPDQPEVQNEDDSDPESGHPESLIGTSSETIQDQSQLQVSETVNENSPLDSSRFNLDIFRGQKQNQETNVSILGSGTKRTPEEHARLIREQIQQAKEGKL